MSARAKTPAAACARYWNKEAKPARKTTRRARRHNDAALLRDILKGTADYDAATAPEAQGCPTIPPASRLPSGPGCEPERHPPATLPVRRAK